MFNIPTTIIINNKFISMHHLNNVILEYLNYIKIHRYNLIRDIYKIILLSNPGLRIVFFIKF